MKEARIYKMSRHHNRAGKLKKTKSNTGPLLDANTVDIAIIDLVLQSLYRNSHIDILHVEKDIYKNANISVPYIESERLWEVMLNSGLVNPVAGFGNAGKLKLSRTGYQLMAQYGGYKQYMDAIKHPQQPQIIIEAPTGIPDDEENDCKEITEKAKQPKTK